MKVRVYLGGRKVRLDHAALLRAVAEAAPKTSGPTAQAKADGPTPEPARREGVGITDELHPERSDEFQRAFRDHTGQAFAAIERLLDARERTSDD